MNEYEPHEANPYESSHFAPDGVTDAETNQWAMAMHLSQLANCVLPPAGWIAPIVIWQLKKNSLPSLDGHGRNIANWIISSLIYTLVSAALVMVLIGVPMLIVLGLLVVIFPIIGGIKASDGDVWKYPGAFRIF